MTKRTILMSNGINEIPRMWYGTAWKKEKTAELITEALKTGFRAIDTACQPRHYSEIGVGKGIRDWMEKHGGRREDIFIQTKFTPVGGQDRDSIPYDPEAFVEDQVRESVTSSLRNLGVEYIDSILLHSPLPTFEETRRAYSALEEFVRAGKVRFLGVSNWYDDKAFVHFYKAVAVKPRFVQNRFVSGYRHDYQLRDFLASQNPPVEYQGFWTLTGNLDSLSSQPVKQIAHVNRMTKETLWYRFLRDEGLILLNGTTNHMEEDLKAMDMPPLTESEMNEIRAFLYRCRKEIETEF